MTKSATKYKIAAMHARVKWYSRVKAAVVALNVPLVRNGGGRRTLPVVDTVLP